MIFKPMKKTIWVFAVLVAAGVLSACGSDAAAARSVKCDNCTETQIKALLGRDSQNANAGDNVVITLRMTGKEHDEVLAWIDDGGDMPSALCRENVYQAVAVHTSFIDTHRWAIVRNDATLFADGRQEHGAHLVGGYATLTLNPRADVQRKYEYAVAEIQVKFDAAENQAQNEYQSAATAEDVVYGPVEAEADNIYKAAVAKAKAAYNAAVPADPAIAYKSAKDEALRTYCAIANTEVTKEMLIESKASKSGCSQKVYDAVYRACAFGYVGLKECNIDELRDNLWKYDAHRAFTTPEIFISEGWGDWTSLRCDGKDSHFKICEAGVAFKLSRNKAEAALATGKSARKAAIAKHRPILDAAIAKAKATRDSAVSEKKTARNISVAKADADRKAVIAKAESVRDAAIAKAERVRDAALVEVKSIEDAQKQYPKTHAALADSYQPGDIIRVLEQGDAPDSLKAGDYRVILYGGIIGERLIAYPIALPNGEAANNCNTAPAVTQYYVSEGGKYAWQAWR